MSTLASAKLHFLAFTILVDITLSKAFQCDSCSYAFDPKNPDADDACVKLPEIYTGSNILKCENYCVVREIYSGERQRVVSYWRACTDNPEGGSCKGDGITEQMICLHTCIGDLCNTWVRGQLHEIYGGIKSPPGPSGGAVQSGGGSGGGVVAVVMMAVLSYLFGPV